jgi:hypothetical protein
MNQRLGGTYHFRFQDRKAVNQETCVLQVARQNKLSVREGRKKGLVPTEY